MQIMQLPPGNMSQIIQLRDLSALEGLDHQVGIDELCDVCFILNTVIPSEIPTDFQRTDAVVTV